MLLMCLNSSYNSKGDLTLKGLQEMPSPLIVQDFTNGFFIKYFLNWQKCCKFELQKRGLKQSSL